MDTNSNVRISVREAIIPSELSNLHNNSSDETKELGRVLSDYFGQRESLDGAIAGLGQRFTGEDFRDLLRPGVYAFFLNGKPLYVGSSYSILQRAAYKDHNAAIARKECDEVLLFPCESKSAAESLETYLIGKMRPLYNIAKRCNYVKDALHVSGATAWAILEANGWRIKPTSSSPVETPESPSTPDLPLQGQLSLGGAP